MVSTSSISRFSYIFVFLVLLTVGVFHIATPLVTVLFSFFALKHLQFKGNKRLAIVLYVILVALIFTGFVFFIRRAAVVLPNIASASIPKILHYASEHEIKVPFDDVDSFKALIVETLRNELRGVARFADVATHEFVFLIIGLVVAMSMFLNAKIDLTRDQHLYPNNAYSVFAEELGKRFSVFYKSFDTVMGAQLIISSINTICTGIFVFAIGLPYAGIGVVITFLCGLLPIVGNIISNTILFGIAATSSLNLALLVLTYLIALHKLEYFLNSKIIGGRIKNPMWLTLLGLLVGERLMGIPGMILAPVILQYVKSEAGAVEVK